MKVAVCITGRLNLLPFNYKLIQKNVLSQLGENVDIFVYSSSSISNKGTIKSNEINLDNFTPEIINKYLKITKMIITKDKELSSKNNILINEWGAGKEKYLQMIYSLYMCNKMIQEYEIEKNIKYDFILRLRVDVLFPIKIPHISTYSNEAITMPDFHNERGGHIPTNKKEFYVEGILKEDIDGRTIHDRFAIGPPKLMNILLNQFILLPRDKDLTIYLNCEHLLNNYLRWHNLSWENKNIIRDKNIIFFRIRLNNDLRMYFDKTDLQRSRHKNDYQYAPNLNLIPGYYKNISDIDLFKLCFQ